MLDWRTLYDEHAPELARFVRRLVRDDEAAADLVQETFVRAIRKERDLRDRAAVRAWLYRIASNVAIEHLRRQRVLAFVPFTGRETDRVDRLDPEIDHVRRALRALPPDQAVTLVLCLQEGLSRREAAAILHVSEETIKSRVARGRARFAQAYRALEVTR